MFESLYLTFSFSTSAGSCSQQATASAGLRVFFSSSIIALLIPELQALLVFEAMAPILLGGVMAAACPASVLCPSSTCDVGSGRRAASATHLLFAAGGLQLLFIFTYYIKKAKDKNTFRKTSDKVFST